MPLAIKRGQSFDHGERGLNCGDAQAAAQTMLERVDLFAHGAGIADDAACPFKDPFAFRREILKTGAAIDEQNAETILQLLDARRECRLGHATSLGGPAEMALARQRQQELEFVDHHPSGLEIMDLVGISGDKRLSWHHTNDRLFQRIVNISIDVLY